MPDQDFSSLGDFESFISQTIRPWSNEKRTVLAAAMAERWLPAYEVFSDKNDWGNPATFADVVQVVWNCVLSRQKLTEEDVKLHQQRLRQDTPHADDFDCEEAIAACAIISDALDCCRRDNNTGRAASAVAYGVAGVAPVLHYDPDKALPKVFRQRKVRNEIAKQFRLIELIGNIAEIDQQQIEALRQKLTSRDLRGPVAPRSKSKDGPTNKTLFERYRKSTEVAIKRTLPLENSYVPRIEARPLIFSIWGSRYVRRRHFIEKLGDVLARDALVAKNLAHDAAVQGDPGWDDSLRLTLRVSYVHPDNGFDVKSPREPHRYGPSFRQLCIEGGAARAWQWAHHRPAAWEEEDQRKQNGFTYNLPELGKLLTRNLTWRRTGDAEQPWATENEGQAWRVRLNDFPDDLMYTLIINDAVIGKFHDWPRSWQREH